MQAWGRGAGAGGGFLARAPPPNVRQRGFGSRQKPIVQSLGNFVFLQDDPWTRLSAILRVVVTPDRRLRLSAIPVHVGPQPTLPARGPADSVRPRLCLRLSPTTARKP